MRFTFITLFFLAGVIQTYSQGIELITVQSKNPTTTKIAYAFKSDKPIKQGSYEKRRDDNSLAINGHYSNYKKDSTWIYYASNGLDTLSVGSYADNQPMGMWTIFDDQCRIRYQFDYSNFDVVNYNWYETPNSFPILTDTAWTVSAIDSPPLMVGLENPMQLITDYLRYPARAWANRISGQVLISFIVEKDGSACDFKVIKGVYNALDTEALRATKLLDKNWFPAKKDGKAITIEYFIQVNFVLL